MKNNGFKDIALDKFDKGEITLDKLESMHKLTQESFARRPSPERLEERDGIGDAIKAIRSREQSA